MWLKEKYPNKKIICWGATSHFLYNASNVRMKNIIYQVFAANYYKKQKMMGQYVKDKYRDKVYTIGFTTYEGRAGLFYNKKIKPAKEESLEYILAQSPYDNSLLPLNDLNLSSLYSRPLGNAYMKNDISKVMDAVIFNKSMRRPTFDNNFFLKNLPRK